MKKYRKCPALEKIQKYRKCPALHPCNPSIIYCTTVHIVLSEPRHFFYCHYIHSFFLLSSLFDTWVMTLHGQTFGRTWKFWRPRHPAADGNLHWVKSKDEPCSPALLCWDPFFYPSGRLPFWAWQVLFPLFPLPPPELVFTFQRPG